MFKVLVPGCRPTRGSKFSACVDLYASEDCVIGAGETKIIGLGICIDLDFNWINRKFNHLADDKKEEYKEWFLSSHYMQLNPRSSLRAKGLISHTGIIDMDYPKEIKIIIHNPLSADFVEVTSKAVGLGYQLKKEGYSDKDIINSQTILCEKMGYSSESYKIKKGDKIAQITLMEHKSYLFGIESEEEREDGFGSTGE